VLIFASSGTGDGGWLGRVVHDGRNISGRGDICRHGLLSTGFAVKEDDTGKSLQEI